MSNPSTERDLERLLAHAGWLTKLARRLVGDPALADDLVQDTWFAALRAPRLDVADARGWLATALANVVRTRARTEGARRWRERESARSEAVEGPDALAERTESQRRLLAALLALEEPYRATLFARYMDGRTPREIARLQGVNESTVRSRLARGHERLRERLERENGDGWALALAPLVGRGGPLEASAGVGAAASSSWVVGAVLKLTAAAVVIGCVWFVWQQRASSEPEEILEPVASLGGAQPPAVEPSDSPMASTQAHDERRAMGEDPHAHTHEAPAAPVLDGTLEIVVERDGVPAPGVGVWIADRREWRIEECLDLAIRPPEGAAFAITDPSGAVAFGGLPRARFTLALDSTPHPSRPRRVVTHELHEGQRYVVELGTASVSGAVFDSFGQPRVGVGIEVIHQHHGKRLILAALARTDERGEYLVDDLAADTYFVVMEPDGRFDGSPEVARRRAIIRSGTHQRVDFGSALGSPVWRGRVRNAFGETVSSTGSLRLSREHDDAYLSVRIDTEGRFEIVHPPGTWKVTAKLPGSPSSGFNLGEFELDERDRELDLVVRGTRLTGRVFAPDGSPSKDRLRVSVRPKGHDYPAAFRTVVLGGEGRYAIDGLTAGTWLLGAFPGQLALGDTMEVEIAEGDSIVVQDLRLVQ